MRMRKLAIAISLAVSAASTQVMGLGLGDIEAKSFLNQPLDAQITVLSVEPHELEGAVIKLASEESFQRAGIDRPYYLNQLKFDLGSNARGQSVVIVTTSQAVKQPFLTFLVEIDWANGRMQREYTLLLDPPVLAQKRQAAIRSAQTGSTRSVSSSSNRTQSSAPVSRNQSSSALGDSYGPTRSNDSLWKIAHRYASDRGVNTNQMMMAILRANQSAFQDGNINLLKKGKTLSIPDAQSASQLSRRQAMLAVMEQNNAWREMRGMAAQHPNVAPTSRNQKALSSAQDTGAKLSLVSPEAGEGSDAFNDPDGVDSGTNNGAADATLVARNEELESEKSRLEARVAELERLLALESNDLASIQQNAIDVEEAAEEMVEEIETLEVVDELIGLEEATELTEGLVDVETPDLALDALSDEASEELSELADVALDDAGEMAADDAVAEESELSGEEVAVEAPADAGGAEPEVVEAVAPPVRTTSILDNPMMLAAGAGAGFLVLLGAIFGLRRKKEAESDDSVANVGEDAFENLDLDDVPDESVDEFNASLDENTEINAASAASEGDHDQTVIEGLDTIEEPISIDGDELEGVEDDVKDDIVAEVDVYLAYGMYDQAEEKVKTAIEGEPNRIDYQAKLAEVYFNTENNTAFIDAATKLQGLTSSEGDSWERIAAMGAQLMPGEAMFASAKTLEELAPVMPGETNIDLDGVDSASSSEDLDVDATMVLDSSELESALSADDEISMDDSIVMESADFELPEMDGLDDTDLTSEETVELDSADLGLGDIDLGDETLEIDATQELSAATLELSPDEIDLSESTLEISEADLDLGEEIDLSSGGDTLEFNIGDLDAFGVEEEDLVDAPAAPEIDESDLIGMTLSEDDLLGSLEEDAAPGLDKTAEISFDGDDNIDDSTLEVDLGGLDMAMGADATLEVEMPDLEPIAEVEPELVEVAAAEPMVESVDEIDLTVDLPSDDELDIDLDPDLDLAATAEHDILTGENGESLADISDDEFLLPEDADEVATKLDLARAFIDMGDVESARGALEEVMAEGNDGFSGCGHRFGCQF